MADNIIYADTSQVQSLTTAMKAALSPENFDKLMRKSLRQTGKATVAESRKEIMKKYYGDAAFVRKAIKKPVISGGGYNLSCDIKIDGRKGKVGGTFAAQGGYYGWNPPKYKIKAKIVKGQDSILPANLSSYGGQPAFRNMGGGGKKYIGKKTKIGRERLPKMKFSTVGNGGAPTLVFTRMKPEANPFFTHSPNRVPYVSVSGLAVAQMTMNRARPGIENKVLINLEKNVTSNFSHIFG